MRSGTLSALAASTLGFTCWMWNVLYEPGTNLLAALSAGVGSYAVIRFTLAAARAERHEQAEREQVRRWLS